IDVLCYVYVIVKFICVHVLSYIIIQLLLYNIYDIFAKMTHACTVTTIISIFLKVFLLIIILHLLYLLFINFTAGTMSRQNPLQMLKTMSPAYFTALGTQSSAATIPVTLHSTKQMKVRENVADFA